MYNYYYNGEQLGSLPKGQKILKGPFGVTKSTRTAWNFTMIFALATKKMSNQKSSVRESK